MSKQPVFFFNRSKHKRSALLQSPILTKLNNRNMFSNGKSVVHSHVRSYVSVKPSTRDKRLMIFHLSLSLLMDKDVTARGKAMRLSQAKAVKKNISS